MGIGTALFGGTAAGLWWQLFRRPLPRTSGRPSRPRARGTGSRSSATAGGCRPSGRRRAADLWFGQGFCHGQDRLWQCEVNRRICLRPGQRDRGPRGPARRPADAHPGPAPSGAARGGGARRATSAALLDAYCAGLNEAARIASAPPAGVPAPPPRVRALAPGRHAGRRQAALLRALDQLGARAAPRRPGPRARRGASREDRPHLSEGQSGGAPARARASTATGCGWRSRSGASASRSAWPAPRAAPTTGR